MTPLKIVLYSLTTSAERTLARSAPSPSAWQTDLAWLQLRIHLELSM